ncbi:hypothetical protein HanIR_Chr12g0561401 [Helianthus annuus]|nr:hypothetical protein HanIR_Chr12g0561401 [Helianthus annuus]
MGYGAGVVSWVGYKRPSHHPGWAWVSAWPLGRGLYLRVKIGEYRCRTGTDRKYVTF